MTEHYIKAKYEVELPGYEDCSFILFQRDDDKFIFLNKPILFPEKEIVSKIQNHMVEFGGFWTPDAKVLIDGALSGDLKPFWTCENKTEENVCTCSIQDLWNFGCQCSK